MRKRKLSAKTAKRLEEPLETKEVRAAIRGLALGKAPGPDGLGTESH